MAPRAQTKQQREATAALGQRLALLRKERGFTQVELAQKLDTSQAAISNYESGRLRPHPDLILRLVDILEVSADQLLGRERPPTKPNGNEAVDRRFLRRLRFVKKLPKRDQDALLRTIDAFLSARNAK